MLWYEEEIKFAIVPQATDCGEAAPKNRREKIIQLASF